MREGVIDTVRVDVDTQHGFCEPRGGLYVKGAERVIADVARLNRDALARGIPLIGSMDAHHYRSAEFRENGGPWPAHCVRGTWDQLKVPATLPERFRIVPWEARVDVAALADEWRAALYFEKDAYSPFTNPNFVAALDLLWGRGPGGGPPRFEVYGVATDFCVRATALDLRRRGAPVAVLLDATAPVSEESGEQAVREMREAGIEIVSVAAALAGRDAPRA